MVLTHSHVTCHDFPDDSLINQLGSQWLNVMPSIGMYIKKEKKIAVVLKRQKWYHLYQQKLADG